MDSTYRPTTNQSIAVVKSGTLLKRQNKLFRTCKRNQPLKKLIDPTRRKSAMQKKQRRTKYIVRMMWSHCGGLDCGE